MKHRAYDIVCLTSNDLSYDRRMIRICQSLGTAGKRVLLVGRRHHKSLELRDYDFDQYRVKCHFNSGPLFYIELNLRFSRLLRRVSYSHLVLVDLDTVPTLLGSTKRPDAVYHIDYHEYFEEVPELQGKLSGGISLPLSIKVSLVFLSVGTIGR